VLLCLLLKTTNPQLAAAAAAQNRAGSSRSHMAAEVMTAARRRVGELQQQLADRVGHMGGLQGGLQALGKLRFKGWGAKPSAQQQQQQLQRGSSGGIAVGDEESSSIGAADNAAGSSQEVAGSDSTAAAAAAAAETVRSPASLQVLLLCLDTLVQRSFTMLRDQLKRRLAPLLSDCMVHPGLTETAAAAAVGVPDSLTAAAAAVGAAFSGGSLAESGQPNNSSSSSSSSSNDNNRLSSGEGAGAAVAGAAAASAAEAEAALLCYRSWSEVVGVMHAAVVALRGAGMPRALTAALVQQVRCDFKTHHVSAVNASCLVLCLKNPSFIDNFLLFWLCSCGLNT
jgi:hypothetical protein